MRDFLKTSDHSSEDLEVLIESAIRLKKRRSFSDKPLASKSIALVFFNPSLRTRASMQVGIYELGGNAVILEPGSTSWLAGWTVMPGGAITVSTELLLRVALVMLLTSTW